MTGMARCRKLEGRVPQRRDEGAKGTSSPCIERKKRQTPSGAFLRANRYPRSVKIWASPLNDLSAGEMTS
jgi:hypothetical protein